MVEDHELWQSGTGFDGKYFQPCTHSNYNTQANTGLRLAQIRAIFKLPSHYGEFPHLLVYVEWFCPLRNPEPVTDLYRLAYSTDS
ncbi:hypothetical protein F4604DRAFT_1595466 [Suillus subluteus]|nr:hypothetical protein F4604DRAFT_1595466 [Suillus subluteus]